jgi:hypothetical protein
LDREGLSQRLELVISLHGELWNVGVVKLSIVSSELDPVQFDIDIASGRGYMKVASDIEGTSKANIIFGSSLRVNGKVVDEFLSRGEKVGANISLYKSGAAEHQT